MDLPLELRQSLVGPIRRRMQIQPAGRKTLCKYSLEIGTCRGYISGLGFAYRVRNVAIRRKVQADLAAFTPVRRNLQNGGSAQATMSDQHFLAKAMMIRCRNHIR